MNSVSTMAMRRWVCRAACDPGSIHTGKEAMRRYTPCGTDSSTSSHSPVNTSPVASLREDSTHKQPREDDAYAWVQDRIDCRVAAGRQSPEAAAYFKSILKDLPEFDQCLKEAQRLTQGQDPERFTLYQQRQYTERLSTFMGEVASKRLREAHTEEQHTNQFMQEGKPTGEAYWLEAGAILSAPDVPNYLKDEMLGEMRNGRRSGSPAFDEPPEVQQMASEDEEYAAYVRRYERHVHPDAGVYGSTLRHASGGGREDVDP